MANAKKACRYCKDYKQVHTMVKVPLGVFCNWAHAIAHGKALAEKKKIKDKVSGDKIARAKHTIDKKSVRSRSKWYATLQKLVNQWVTKVRDADEACCTCGTRSVDIKYDAGHFFTVGARKDIRFNPMNIHKQCSQQCNVYGSGMRLEYERFIIARYGEKGLDELTLEGKTLKDQFPAWQDIENEIIRYRKILRNAGIKPCI
jgi:hypothetical protein